MPKASRVAALQEFAEVPAPLTASHGPPLHNPRLIEWFYRMLTGSTASRPANRAATSWATSRTRGSLTTP